jgi:DNA-binding MarR family transcriptional regulator
VRPEETVCFNIKTAWHAIHRMYNSVAVAYDSSMSVGFVLLNIDLEQGTPSTKIAPLIGLESRSITRMLKNLEETGLIERRPDLYDKRSVRIFLTDRGKEKRETAKQAVLEFNQRVRSIIPSDQLNVFFEVIRQINSLTENEKSIQPL